MACPLSRENCGFEKSYLSIVLYHADMAFGSNWVKACSFELVLDTYSIYEVCPKQGGEVESSVHFLATFWASDSNSLLTARGGAL